jgi:hypothetical protein
LYALHSRVLFKLKLENGLRRFLSSVVKAILYYIKEIYDIQKCCMKRH